MLNKSQDFDNIITYDHYKYYRVVSGTGGLIEQNTPFFTVKTLLTRLLELDTCSNIHDKEQLILQHIVDDDLRKLLPILNDLLVLKVKLYHNLCNSMIKTLKL